MTDEYNPEDIDFDDPRELKPIPPLTAEEVQAQAAIQATLGPPLQPEEIPAFWRPKLEQVPEVEPDGIIIPPPAVDPKVFETLLVQPPKFDPDGPIGDIDPEEHKEARQRVEAEFGQLRAEQIPGAYFRRTDVPVVAGEYQFRVEQRLLKEALETTELTTVRRIDHFNKVLVTLYRNRLKLQTYCGMSFSEYLVPLLEPSPSIPADRAQDLAPAFVFDHELLLRLVQRMPSELIDFTYVADKHTLGFQIREDRDDPHSTVHKDFLLTCEDRADFPDYRSPLTPNPTLLGKINPVILRKAVRYVRLFARKDETRAPLNLIELRDGVMFGGTQIHIGRFEAPALKGVDLKIQFDLIATVEPMLARLNPDDCSVLETERYTILTDGVLAFGFMRYGFTFPDMTNVYKHESDNHLLVSRGELCTSLSLLAAVSKDNRDALVEIQMQGEGPDARLDLLARERCGKPCTAVVTSSYRNENPGQTSKFPPWTFSVHTMALLDLVQHFESASVHLEVYNDNALYVYDEDDSCTARSLLCFMTQAQVQSLKELNRKAAAAARKAGLH